MTSESCIDVQDFRFKSAAKTKVFNGAWTDVSSNLALIATASRFGLAFAGTPNGFKVYEIKSLLAAGESNANVPCREVPVDGSLKMLHINCDDTLLAVVIGTQGGQPRALIYQVSSFLTTPTISPSGHVVLASGEGQTLSDFAWNPVNPAAFCVCLSDGQVSSFEVKGPSSISLINSVAAGAACVAWSPKGKQLVAATRDGRLSQFMPDLRPVKTVGPPEGLGQSPEAVSVVWLSSFQFGVVFRLGGADDQRLSLCVVNTPKNGPVTAQDFDDVCYSSGDLRQNQFYLNMVSNWGILLVASANGAEVGLLGQKEASVWQQWTLEDSARAELPLESCADTFPLGMAFCTSATEQLVWEEAQLPHMPILLLLSHCGTLCAFHALNVKPGANQICQPIEAQPQPGLFVATSVAAPSVIVQTPPTVKEQPKPVAPAMSFGQPPAPAPQPALAAPPKTFSIPPPAAPAPVVNPFSSSLPSVAASQPPASKPPSAALFSTPPPALNLTSKVEPQLPPPQPLPEVKVAKEVVPEPAMSEESFMAASSAIMRQFSEEIATSLKQSADTTFTVASCEDSSQIAMTLNSAEEKSVELQQKANEFNQQLNELQILNLEVIRQYEEIRTRQVQRENPGYIQAARTRPLDPTTQAQKQEIASKLQYIESQTGQAISLIDQALTVHPFKPSSNMALHRTLILQRRCIANMSARLDAMESKVGRQTPAILDMSSLSAALPKTPTKQEQALSRDQELRLSSFLKDRPIALVKRRLPPPVTSPLKPVSPLQPISPPKFASPAAQPQPSPAAKEQFIPSGFSLPSGITITKAAQPAPFPAATFPKESPKPAISIAPAAAPPFSFSTSTKPFSFSSESKPTEFLFGAAKESKPSGISIAVDALKHKEEAKKSPARIEVEVVTSTDAATEEKQKFIEVKAKEKDASPILASILQSSPSTPPPAEKPSIFSQPLLATPTTGSIFSTPTTTTKQSLFSGSNLFATTPATTTTATSSAAAGSAPKFAFGTPSFAPSTATPSTFAFGSSTKTPLFATNPATTASIPDSTSTAAETTTTTAAPVVTKAAKPLESTPDASTTTSRSLNFGFATLATTTTSSTVVSSAPTLAFGTSTTPSTPDTTTTTTSSSAPALSLFGLASTPATKTETTATVTPLLSTPTSKPSAPLFGTPATEPTAAPPTTSPFASTPLFGSAPAATTAAPTFGSAPAFGAPTTTTAAAPFASTSVFGAAPTSTAPSFGTPSAAASTFSFASAAPPAAAADQVTNLFGGMGSGGTLFGSASFASSPKPAASIFGGGGATTPASSDQNLFGGMQACSPSAPKNLFGQTQAQANPFSTPKPATPASTNLFGQSPSSAPANTGGSSFGQSGGALFGQAFSPSKSVFGGAPTFGSSGGFGSAPSFGAMTTPQQPAFGGGGGSGHIFGSPAASTPSFGQPAAAAPPSGLFGAAAAENLSFGNLAQQQPPAFSQQPQPPQNNNQSFGGNSFSSWR